MKKILFLLFFNNFFVFLFFNNYLTKTFLGIAIKDSFSLPRFIVRKSSYQVYSYFCQCPSNGISISARLKEKVSAWGFCLEEFSILVKDTPDDQQWVVVHHIFSVEKTDFARCAD